MLCGQESTREGEKKEMLKGKVVLITGCSRGIGREMMLTFAENGAIVYANARAQGCLDEYVGEERNCGKIIPIYFDVRDAEKCKMAVLQVKKEQGKLDVLVNNAGVMKDAYLEMVDQKTINDVFETNVYATIYMTQYAVRMMKRKNCGSIINMSSIVGVSGNAGQTVYSASKGAVATLTKTWAKELAENHIRVNAIAPGKIDTDMYHSIGEERVKEGIKEIGFGRLGTPKEIANAALYLASDMSEYVTGQILGVNGGVFI